ncbi:hypothetical protein ACFZAV_44785 [Streptomyces sp. NPDC008343]|uniref:hypothetical protein n=1 Tax=Streptomyces sp. NPDC008343 TaxID=3364828 RepID=UPI0036ED6263
MSKDEQRQDPSACLTGEGPAQSGTQHAAHLPGGHRCQFGEIALAQAACSGGNKTENVVPDSLIVRPVGEFVFQTIASEQSVG